MKLKYNGHNYRITPIYYLKKLVFERPYFRPTMTFFGHGDGCCDYWTPITDPRAVRALMLDDDLGLSQRLSETVSQNKPSKNATDPNKRPEEAQA